MHALWTCWEKSSKCLGAAEENQEKVKAICYLLLSTAFSVSRILFWRENKNSNFDNFLPEFDIANLRPFKILTTLPVSYGSVGLTFSFYRTFGSSHRAFMVVTGFITITFLAFTSVVQIFQMSIFTFCLKFFATFPWFLESIKCFVH